MAAEDTPILFALSESRAYGERVARRLGVLLTPHEERGFEDGEHKTRPLDAIHGHEVFVIQSLHGDATKSVNDKLCRLLFFIGAIRDAGAARTTVVAPYLCYARKDRKTQPYDPTTTRYVAQMLEACGADAVVTLDVHNIAAFQNAFRRPTMHLEAWALFVEHFVPLVGDAQVVVVSPDIGGTKRAEQFRRGLARALGREPGFAVQEKHRGGGVVAGDLFLGDVAGRVAIVIDDLVSTGGTLRRAAERCRAGGALAVFVAVTHGLLIGEGAAALLSDPAFDRIVITDTVEPRCGLPAGSKLECIDTSGLVADAIRTILGGRPASGSASAA
ncbi:ribose-phosphate pyrophosphokinase [Mycobacterium sp. KBS0706]|uniref:ribose-phosphate diphosphokinase n=1 Tax=Mycobacterium sp. KBS0706 TaxID=2578109 RepID=UPI00110F8477|nr:ribose-phosphate diphosphokinase [Mycobacterium sp. KBS0706]TSD84058.1 ribose-phosphate pyrophosphokinase [Mycobacterium sp. KBS0706]